MDGIDDEPEPSAMSHQPSAISHQPSLLRPVRQAEPFHEVSSAADHLHIDVLTRGCDVWIDDEQVIGRGRYLMERFGLADRTQD